MSDDPKMLGVAFRPLAAPGAQGPGEMARRNGMRITLCGSARFEKEFKEYNRRLTLAGHVVYSLAVYPSDMSGKDWYTPDQKVMLDAAHLAKIDNSDAIMIVRGDYIGESTAREIAHALAAGKNIMCAYPVVAGVPHDRLIRTCSFEGCFDPTSTGPCALCYE